MIRTIVEGEPGIFPDPVARIMRSIGGLFRRGPSAADAPAPEAPAPPDDGDDGATDAADPHDHSGEQR